MRSDAGGAGVPACYPDLTARRARVSRLLAQGTPLYLGFRDILLARYRELRDALDARWPDAIVAYSFKTNDQVARTGLLRRAGAWAEVVSGREYALARALGFPARRVVFNGPHKSDPDLLDALEAGALVNLNDPAELARAVALTRNRARPVPVGLRISSPLPGGGESRFGFSMQTTEARLAANAVLAAPGLRLAGLHLHLYGDVDEPRWYREAAGHLFQLAARCLDDGMALEYLDVGGGFPAHSPKPYSRSTWRPRPVRRYIDVIAAEYDRYLGGRRLRVIVEPGRFLVTDGIVFVSRVLSVRSRHRQRVVTTDGTISMVPLTHYRPQVVRAFTPQLVPRIGPRRGAAVHGATCRENDVLYRGPLPHVEVGDYVVHYAAGAYNAALCPEFIFERPALRLA